MARGNSQVAIEGGGAGGGLSQNELSENKSIIILCITFPPSEDQCYNCQCPIFFCLRTLPSMSLLH